MAASERKGGLESRSSRLHRWLPLLGIGLVVALVFGMGWNNYLTFKTIGANHQWLKSIIAAHLPATLLAYTLIYIAMVGFSLPGTLVMTLTGGMLFGWLYGTLATTIGANVGAVAIFLAARSSLGEALTARAGPWLGRLREGFHRNALSYLLFLRLVPIFPFWLINLAAAALNVPLRTFVIGTAIGFFPPVLAMSVAGSGLANVIEAQNAKHAACLAAQPAERCLYSIDARSLITGELVFGLTLLGVLAILPVVYRKLRDRNGGNGVKSL